MMWIRHISSAELCMPDAGSWGPHVPMNFTTNFLDYIGFRAEVGCNVPITPSTKFCVLYLLLRSIYISGHSPFRFNWTYPSSDMKMKLARYISSLQPKSERNMQSSKSMRNCKVPAHSNTIHDLRRRRNAN